ARPHRARPPPGARALSGQARPNVRPDPRPARRPAKRSPASRARSGHAGAITAVAGQLEAEAGALRRARLRPDAPAVGLDDRARDREPEPASALVAGAARIRAVEAIEHPVELLGRQARSGVGDAELDPAVTGHDPDGDAIVRGCLADCVAHEVSEHLPEPVGIDDKLAV